MAYLNTLDATRHKKQIQRNLTRKLMSLAVSFERAKSRPDTLAPIALPAIGARVSI